jgi:hypothetical protein
MHYATGPQGFFDFSDIIPRLTAYEYKGHIISGWPRPETTNGFTAVGIAYERDQLGSMIQVKRIEGELFETKEQAQQHGLELCKEWLDKQSEFNGPQRSEA